MVLCGTFKLTFGTWDFKYIIGTVPQESAQVVTLIIDTGLWSMAGVFNLSSSRANLHLSYNPAGRSHCRLQNHHGYIKLNHRDMGGSPGDVVEVPMTSVKQRKGCRMSCDVGKEAERVGE